MLLNQDKNIPVCSNNCMQYIASGSTPNSFAASMALGGIVMHGNARRSMNWSWKQGNQYQACKTALLLSVLHTRRGLFCLLTRYLPYKAPAIVVHDMPSIECKASFIFVALRLSDSKIAFFSCEYTGKDSSPSFGGRTYLYEFIFSRGQWNKGLPLIQ